MKQMRLLFSMLALSALALTFASCDKNNGDEKKNDEVAERYKNAPRSELPDELVVRMSTGGASVINIYNDRASYLGNQETHLVEWNFTKDGYFERHQALTVASGACFNTVFSHKKGTVKFEAPNIVYLTDCEGHFVHKFPCTSGTREFDGDASDLLSRKYYYKSFYPYGPNQPRAIEFYRDAAMNDLEFRYDVVK